MSYLHELNLSGVNGIIKCKRNSARFSIHSRSMRGHSEPSDRACVRRRHHINKCRLPACVNAWSTRRTKTRCLFYDLIDCPLMVNSVECILAVCARQTPEGIDGMPMDLTPSGLELHFFRNVRFCAEHIRYVSQWHLVPANERAAIPVDWCDALCVLRWQQKLRS